MNSKKQDKKMKYTNNTRKVQINICLRTRFCIVSE